jgi:hypothetical protein
MLDDFRKESSKKYVSDCLTLKNLFPSPSTVPIELQTTAESIDRNLDEK